MKLKIKNEKCKIWHAYPNDTPNPSSPHVRHSASANLSQSTVDKSAGALWRTLGGDQLDSRQKISGMTYWLRYSDKVSVRFSGVPRREEGK